ncbi:hypothetical protein VD0003_g1040 [Verticillium dahliae]|nr:hypothetical protein VD0003_g1040 [Verticillium dahliae]
MGGRIDAYLDIASLYSYFTIEELLKNKDRLAAHGVQVDLHPVLLGAINVGSGNKPPWTLPAKATYGNFDSHRSAVRVGLNNISPPEDLMADSMTVVPLRALYVIKSTYGEAAFLATFRYLFEAFWTAPNKKVAKEAVLAEVLADVPGPRGGKLFSADDVERIISGAKTQEAKNTLKAQTQKAIDQGAFRAPWFWVTNPQGKEEPFFGSDRFHFIYKFLGLPFQDISLLPPGEKAAKL